MNRPIEFRAFNKNLKIMVPVVAINSQEGLLSSGEINEDTGKLVWRQLACFELIQFTGLFDKNGVKIFEGDIVNDYLSIGKVIWHKQSASFRVDYGNCIDDMFDIACVEIIGNIFEHPELLEEK